MAQQFATIPDDLSDVRVLVVGDVMLDRYWFGRVNRISPEAPVPVVQVDRSEDRPGGAANVARNVTALGAQATLFSVIGIDEPGLSLKRLLFDTGVKLCLSEDPDLTTTLKLRVIGRQQQMVRIDFEYRPSLTVLEEQFVAFQEQLLLHDVVVVSDYDKGVLQYIERMIEAAARVGKPVFVDPKGIDYGRYRGATLVTPNRSEMQQVVGVWQSEEELEAKANALRERLACSAILVTRSEEGMSLFEGHGRADEPAVTQEVFDVSGAGDTSIAALAVMSAAGWSLADAMRVSNCAAGIVVGKFGTAVVTHEELKTGWQAYQLTLQ